MNSLTPEESHVILNKGTEAPYSGEFHDNHRDGVYLCRQCDTPLYLSDTKFDSGCGWPSFDQAIPGRVTMTTDADWHRAEITCTTCGGHLGHVFVGEQMTEENTRHCVNSLSMRFIPTDQIEAKGIIIPDYKTIIVGGGCFRCIEGALSHVPGIIQCLSGYAGGRRPFPSYEQVCTWVSGHHEVVKIWYEESIITLQQVLSYFMAIHDPTSMDKQWWDEWVQYRSVIVVADEQESNSESPWGEKQIVDSFISELDASDIYDVPIVTQVLVGERFRVAESYHQDFYTNNPSKPYCQLVVKPKLEKILSLIKHL